MAAIAPQPKLQFFDANGNPLAGGKLYSYAAGTTTPLATYTDSTGGSANPNPIILDSRGEASVWLGSALYKLRLDSATNVNIWTVDNIGGAATLAELAASGGSALIGFLQSGTSAVSRTVQSKLRDVISVKDFGATGTGSDDTAAFNAALTAAAGKALYVPAATSYYAITGELAIPDGTTIYGDGYGSLLTQTANAINILVPGNNVTIKGLNIQGNGANSGGVTSFTKNNGVYALSKRNIKIVECFITNFEYNGVQINNCIDIEVQNNYFWDNKYSSGTSADVIIYGTSGGSSKINIAKNFCLSNNSQGISIDSIGVDNNILVEGNICVPMNTSTWVEVSSGSLLRRHGIEIGYNGGVNAGLHTVANNLCRQTRQTGIYYQANTAPGHGVQILGNQCSANGINPISVGFTAGIYVACQGDGDLIANNLVEDFSEAVETQSAGIRVSPASSGQVSTNARTEINGNIIRNSLGHGIVLGGYSINVLISNNTIATSTYSDIGWFPVAGVTSVGNHVIQGNVTQRSNTTKPSVELDYQASTYATRITNNVLVGKDYTVSSTSNVGIKWNTNPKIYVFDNEVRNFYYGTYQSNYLTGRAFSQQYIDRNTFVDCNVGIMISGTTTDPVLPLQDNQFVNVTTSTSGAALGGSTVGYLAQRFGTKIYFQAAAVPAVGTWVQGDRAYQSTPVVGQPKGWFCTVAGTPGTWVSEGNL